VKKMPVRTPLTERLGIRHPVLLAPMGSSAGGALAGAVSAAGGLGLIGGGLGNRDWLEREFKLAGNQRVGVGFITWGLAQRPELLEVALDHHPAAFMLSFGDAAPFLPRVKRAGIPAICQIQTLEQARTVLAQGADIVIAQGAEGGGHGSRRGTFPLVPAVVDAAAGTGALVVAAGGIADGRGLAAALMLGASGVLMGTRFHAATESLASTGIKARIVAGSGDDTLRTRVFDIVRKMPWPEQFTGRALANSFSGSWHGQEATLARDETAQAAYTQALAAEDYDTAVVWASEAIDLIHAIEPAGTILTRIVAEAEAALARRFD
jgi:nitronate monooxygenase